MPGCCAVRERPGDLDLSRSLDRLGRGRPRPHADRDAFALAMLPLAAKFVARGQDDTAAAMTAMLGAASDLPPLKALRAVFDAVGGSDPGREHAEARRRVDRYLEVVEALSRNERDRIEARIAPSDGNPEVHAGFSCSAAT